MDTRVALFDNRRIPRQIVVNRRIRPSDVPKFVTAQ